MAAQHAGIGGRFQQETKYHRARMTGGVLDWRRKPEEFKEYPGDIDTSIWTPAISARICISLPHRWDWGVVPSGPFTRMR